MGLIYRGLPLDLVCDLATRNKLDLFVETGTFKGDSLAEARQIFTTCHSIEIADEFYQIAKKRFENESNIHLLLGNSAEKLKEIDFSNAPAAFFWLDAHYSGGPTGGKDDCPLLREVEHIASLPIEKYILIDDARYVLSPYQGERYCEIKELFNLLPPENYSVVINDVVVSVPARSKYIVDAYCAKQTESNQRKIKSKRIRAFVKKIVGDL